MPRDKLEATPSSKRRRRLTSVSTHSSNGEEFKESIASPGSPMPTMSDLEAMEGVTQVQYDDEDDGNKTVDLEEEVKPRTLHEALEIISKLRAEINELKAKPQLNGHTGSVLSSAMFSVDSPRTVSKVRLGRSSSMSTQSALRRLNSEPRNIQNAGMILDNLFERANHFLKERYLESEAEYFNSVNFADDILALCERSMAYFDQSPKLLRLASPMYVFGDLHGNMEDFRFFAEHVWPMGMRLSAGRFLFLGDYVDRGYYGLELVTYLLCQKLQLPDKVYLIRGNHETRAVNGWESFYGPGSFIHQCKARFGEAKGIEVWESLNNVFDRMPLAAVVDDSIFCVHGGISCSTSGDTTDLLERIADLPSAIDIRPPDANAPSKANRLAFDLLWADPADRLSEELLDLSENGFGQSARGGGAMVFGNKAVANFLEHYNLDYIIRAHEATANGIAVCKSARVLTIFSTSKDHGCGGDAKCGCVLIDRQRIQAITRNSSYGYHVVDKPMPALAE